MGKTVTDFFHHGGLSTLRSARPPQVYLPENHRLDTRELDGAVIETRLIRYMATFADVNDDYRTALEQMLESVSHQSLWVNEFPVGEKLIIDAPWEAVSASPENILILWPVGQAPARPFSVIAIVTMRSKMSTAEEDAYGLAHYVYDPIESFWFLAGRLGAMCGSSENIPYDTRQKAMDARGLWEPVLREKIPGVSRREAAEALVGMTRPLPGSEVQS